MNFNYNDIIEYIDCTFDENFEEAKHWCKENNAELVENIESRVWKEVEEVNPENDSEKIKQNKLFRYFQIQQIPEYIPTPEELARQEIQQLKQQLANTDYVVIKIAEGSATEEEYADVIAQRRAWRARIDELEQLLKQ